jgi:hypothetical protein
MNKIEFYDEINEENGCFYYLENTRELGEFIGTVHPKVKLDSIPTCKWFVYFINERGDHRFDSLTSLVEYKEEKIQALLSIAKMIRTIEELD